MKKILSIFAGFGLSIASVSPLTSTVSCSNSSLYFSNKYYIGKSINDTLNQFYIDLATRYNGALSEDDNENIYSAYSDESSETTKSDIKQIDSDWYYSSICEQPQDTGTDQSNVNPATVLTIGDCNYYDFASAVRSYDNESFPTSTDDIDDMSYIFYYFTNFANCKNALSDSNSSDDSTPDDDTKLQSKTTSISTFSPDDLEITDIPANKADSSDEDKQKYNKWSNWSEDLLSFTIQFSKTKDSDSDSDGDSEPDTVILRVDYN